MQHELRSVIDDARIAGLLDDDHLGSQLLAVDVDSHGATSALTSAFAFATSAPSASATLPPGAITTSEPTFAIFPIREVSNAATRSRSMSSAAPDAAAASRLVDRASKSAII